MRKGADSRTAFVALLDGTARVLASSVSLRVVGLLLVVVLLISGGGPPI
jgi:hypothetical protein